MDIKNIYKRKINVLGKELKPDEFRELTSEEVKSNEIKTLIRNKYIEKVK